MTEPDNEIWFSKRPLRRIRAKQICAGCWLLTECHDWALLHFVLGKSTSVVVGGMTEKDIRNQRRELHIVIPNSTDARGVALRAAHTQGRHDYRANHDCPDC